MNMLPQPTSFSENPETQSEVSPRNASFWLSEIEAAQSRNDSWYCKAEEAEDRYRDCEDEEERGFGGLNILWANVETQKAAIGEDFGKPQVMRVNMPENDGGLARHVSMVWERSIEASVKEGDDNHDIALAVGDMFLPGKGQVWIEIEAEEDDRKWVTSSICRVCYRDYLEGAATRWGSIPWVARRHYFTRDELVSECRMSEERAEKVPLNVSLPNSGSKSGIEDAKGKEQFKRAEVWEIWAKFPVKSRIFVAVGHKDEVLRYDKDPLGLKKFFPCPRPMQANGDESRPPLTDYSRYQDQAEELDRLSERIFVLTETLRRVGIHDKAFKELADIAEAEENTTIAVENWAQLQASGGLAKVQEWQDIVPIANVLAALHQQRDTLLRLIYELSGISDLARGHTDPDETLGAQKLKQSFGSSRFKRREKESRRFASEAYQLKGEVIAELFPREQLEQMSGIRMPLRAEIDDAKRQVAEIMQIQQQAEQARQQLAQLQQQLQQQQQGQQAQPQPQQPPQPGQPPQGQPTPQPPVAPPHPQVIARLQQQAQTPPPDQKQLAHLTELAQIKFSWEDISGVLRSDARRCYSVEVATDQTAFIDEEADKAARSQFFSAVMSAMQQIGPMIAGNPKNGEVFKQLIMFVVSSFKAGRSMEEGIEQAIDAAIEQAAEQAGQPQQQDPKAQADMAKAQADMAQAQSKVQEAGIRLEQAQVQLQKEQVQLEQAKVEAQRAGADIQVKAVGAQLKERQAQIKAAAEEHKAQVDTQKTQVKAAETQQKLMESQAKAALEHEKNEAKRLGQAIEAQGKAEKLDFERTQRATAREEILKDNHTKEQDRRQQITPEVA